MRANKKTRERKTESALPSNKQTHCIETNKTTTSGTTPRNRRRRWFVFGLQKRLDFFASALCTYPTSSGVSNIIIATHRLRPTTDGCAQTLVVADACRCSSTLMFYKSLSLIWAATLSFVPVRHSASPRPHLH
jgi:hypothetical protein